MQTESSNDEGGRRFSRQQKLLTIFVFAFGAGEVTAQSVKATEEWVALHDGSVSQLDNGATAVDAGGNVYGIG